MSDSDFVHSFEFQKLIQLKNTSFIEIESTCFLELDVKHNVFHYTYDILQLWTEHNETEAFLRILTSIEKVHMSTLQILLHSQF